MTRNNKTNFTTKRNILAFVLAIFMCISLCFAVACKKDTTATIPEYSYTDVDDGIIKNPNFTYGTDIMDYDEYPKTNVTGWNIEKNSSAKSGVIDVSKLGWKEFMYNAYSDNGIMNYVKSLNGNFTDSDIKQAIRNEGIATTPKAEHVKEYVVKNYLLSETAKDGVKYAFINPGVPTGASDNKIYMLNNYRTGDLGFGTIQTVTSASEVTLNAGEYAKITVSVKTANLNTTNTSVGYGESIGANIRVKNSLNSKSQADFGIYNITCTTWTDYFFYVKADEVYESKFSVELGLGYDNYYAEGTVYFDDVKVEILDEEDVASLTFIENKIDYNNLDNNIKVDAYTFENKNYLYNMSVDMTNLSNVEIGSFASASHDFTQYKGGTKNGNPTNAPKNEVVALTTENNLSNAPYGIKDGIKVDLKKPASYSIKLDGFELASEEYVALTFFVKNQLNKLYSTEITINVLDIYIDKQEERPAIAKLSEVNDDWTKLTVLIQNNFDRVVYDSDIREFELEIVIGPDSEQDNIDSYAFGSVYITNPIVTSGVTYQYVDETAKENKDQTENYDYYSLLKATATGTTALFAGYPNDYDADEADASTYNMVVSPSDLGAILNKPASPKGYTGVESGHYYIGGDEKVIDINTNTKAGVINTKYLSNYPSDVVNALNYTDSDNIQPLMITPITGKSYGFIGEPYTINANSQAKITLKVKVVGDANAFIYLVDTSSSQKGVLKFDAFDINTDAGEFNTDITNKHVEEKELMFNLSNTQDWIDLEFYIATGNTSKQFRLEFWNGERSDTTTETNKGFLFVNDVTVTTTNGFDEIPRWEDAFTTQGNPLYQKADQFDKNNLGNLIAHKRELTDIEIEYNNDTDKKGSNVNPRPKYIWAQTDSFIYAIYDTIDPTPVNPYDNEIDDTVTEEESLIKTDPATFWLSFSSIALGVVLVLAIIALFVKNIRRRRKANASDAKSHYTVKSRVSKPKNEKKQKVQKQEEIVEDEVVNKNSDVEEQTETTVEEQVESTEEVEEATEQTLDDYVYGDVQDFGEKENQETNQDKQQND